VASDAWDDAFLKLFTLNESSPPIAAVPVSVWQVEHRLPLNWVLPAAMLPLLELPELELLEELDELLLEELLLEELEDELEDELLELGSPELELLPPHANRVADNNSGIPQRPTPVRFL